MWVCEPCEYNLDAQVITTNRKMVVTTVIGRGNQNRKLC